jgi:GcrA cell cycle regulator
MSEQRIDWNERNVELLKSLWSQGLIASEIAEEFGHAELQNAIIGKANRRGLEARPRGAKPRRIAKPSNCQQDTDKSDSETIDLPSDHTDCGVGLLKLSDRTCRWPIGDPQSEAFIFCGAVPSSKSPYCSRHTRLAYAPRRGPLPINEQERERRRKQARANMGVGSAAG